MHALAYDVILISLLLRLMVGHTESTDTGTIHASWGLQSCRISKTPHSGSVNKSGRKQFAVAVHVVNWSLSICCEFSAGFVLYAAGFSGSTCDWLGLRDVARVGGFDRCHRRV